jgi:hypothetical protein
MKLSIIQSLLCLCPVPMQAHVSNELTLKDFYDPFKAQW